MKKMLVLFLVLTACTIANAALQIGVNGTANPSDSSITLQVNQTAELSIWGDGQTPQNTSLYMFVQGFGTIGGGRMLWNGNAAMITATNPGDLIDEGDPGAGTWGQYFSSIGYDGTQNSILFVEFQDTTVPPIESPLSGFLADQISFKCTGVGDATITMINPDSLAVYDSQVIHQVPEPATMLLLGIGGLVIRRFRK